MRREISAGKVVGPGEREGGGCAEQGNGAVCAASRGRSAGRTLQSPH